MGQSFENAAAVEDYNAIRARSSTEGAKPFRAL